MRACPHTKHDAIEIEEVPSSVQIIDPTHPLFSRTLPIAKFPTPHGLNWISVEMPCGYNRIIHRHATSLDHDALTEDTLLQLSRISVPLMLHLQQLLDKQHQRTEHENERDTEESRERITRDDNAVAAIDPTTTRTNCSGDTAHSATVAKPISSTGGQK